MLSISTKELRSNFQYVIEMLANDKVFLLIHKSKPVAEIRKPKLVMHFAESTDEDIKKSTLVDIWTDYLNNDELNYYLSLK